MKKQVTEVLKYATCPGASTSIASPGTSTSIASPGTSTSIAVCHMIDTLSGPSDGF